MLDDLIIPNLPSAGSITWLSPLCEDQYAEYRDRAFLERIEATWLARELEAFWPRRGPQWDALASCDDGSVLLIEAKAHIKELCSPASQASPSSRERINNSLRETASFIGATHRDAWSEIFYQLTNRIAHLYFLRKHGVKAWLVLVNFIGDTQMEGPLSVLEWTAAYQVAWYVLGIPKQHKLSPYMIEIFPRVGQSAGNTGL